MKSKPVSSLLTVAFVAIGLFAYRQHLENVDLKAQLLDARASLDTQLETPTIQGAEPPIQGEQPLSVPEPTSARSHANALEPAERKRVIRDLSKMLENPQMNEMMQASQKATLEIMYKDLLDSYDFTPEERIHLMDLLMARQMFRVETSMKLIGGNNSADEAKLLGEEMREYDLAIKDEIETFLNNESDMNEFEFYEKTIAERMSLSGFKSSMAQAGKPISAETERNLLTLIVDQKESYNFRSDLHDDQNYNIGPERFSAENIDTFESDLSGLHEIIAQEADALLDDQQLVALVEALEGMRDLQLSQLRMAANMFGGQKKS